MKKGVIFIALVFSLFLAVNLVYANGTAPVFTNLANKTLDSGPSLEYDIDAESPILDCFDIDNLTLFAINCSGFLTNVSGLDSGLAYELNVSVNDTLGNQNSGLITISVLAGDQKYASVENLTIEGGTSEVVVDTGSPVKKITIPVTMDNATGINVSLVSLLSEGNVTLGNDFTLNRESDASNYSAIISSGSVISGGQEWDGKISLPTIMSNTEYTAPSSGAVDVVVDIGSGVELNFSEPVKIIIGGMSGKRAAWSRGTGTLADVNLVCDSTVNPTNIAFDGTRECYRDDGEDLIIWTYHFTAFSAYTPAATTGSVIISDSTSSNSGRKGKIGTGLVGERIKITETAASNKEIEGIATEGNSGAVEVEGEKETGVTGAVIGTGRKTSAVLIAAAVVLIILGLTFSKANKKQRFRNYGIF